VIGAGETEGRQSGAAWKCVTAPFPAWHRGAPDRAVYSTFSADVERGERVIALEILGTACQPGFRPGQVRTPCQRAREPSQRSVPPPGSRHPYSESTQAATTPLLVLRREAGGWFIDKECSRTRHESACQREQIAFAAAQRARSATARRAQVWEEFKHLIGSLANAGAH